MTKTFGNIFLGLLAVAGMSALTSCDDIKPDDRYIPGEAITAERAVLLEDFTGQYCVNCPQAHDVIKQLEEQYGKDKVIAVSIHSGGFGISTSQTNFGLNFVGLMTEEGNTIMTSYGIESFPMGIINFGRPEVYDLWPTSVRNALMVPTDVQIDLKAEFVPTPTDEVGDEDSDEYTDGYFGNIEIEAEVMSGSSRTVNVQFWITEDNIVALQKSLDKTIPDYVHDNVFRAQVLNGLRGESYSLTGGVEKVVDGSIATRWTDKERWEVKNLSVVAIVSDKTGVLQVKRVKLYPDADTTPND